MCSFLYQSYFLKIDRHENNFHMSVYLIHSNAHTVPSTVSYTAPVQEIASDREVEKNNILGYPHQVLPPLREGAGVITGRLRCPQKEEMPRGREQFSYGIAANNPH